MKNLSRSEMLHLIKYYEQCYFTYDKEIPFKGDLNVYPILVKDYYKFYLTAIFLCSKQLCRLRKALRQSPN